MNEQSTMLQFDNAGASINAYCVGPGGSSSSGDGPHPAIIVIQEVFGLNDHIKDVCNRIASQGYLVLGVDLYSRQGMPSGLTDSQKIMEFMATVSDAQAVSDLQAGLSYLQGRPDVLSSQIGVVGFCMGGAYTHMFACSTPELACAMSFYGGLRWPFHNDNKPRDAIDFTEGLNCPLLSIFGDTDHTIPLDHVRELEALTKKLGKEHEVVVYPGVGHAFFNDTREQSYHAESADDAWQRLCAFFSAHLKR